MGLFRGEDMTENIINEMVTLANKKLECLKIILDLKPRQNEAIKEEDMEGVGYTIDLIQNQINIIDDLDCQYNSKLSELRSIANIDDMSQLDDMKYLCAKELKDNLDKIKDLLKQIKILDDENILLMNEKFQETKEMLKNLRQGKKMAKGYLTDYNSSTMFIDERN